MNAVARFYGTPLGKKILVAVTGAILALFLVGHVVGNLLVFEGGGHDGEPARIDSYAEFLRFDPLLLWALRVVLLTAVVLHAVTVIQLYFENRAARGSTRYAVQKRQRSTLASRTMIVGGIVLAGFVVYHILHFTTGTVHAGLFEYGRVYDNVARSFQNPFIVGAYLVAQAFLFLHLRHGILSLAETLGVSHPRYLTLFRRGGPLIALLLVLGFSSVPLAVFFGIVH
jgi:succinate dehydrogenase / fumarate reductase cytochrome b subunit